MMSFFEVVVIAFVVVVVVVVVPPPLDLIPVQGLFSINPFEIKHTAKVPVCPQSFIYM